MNALEREDECRLADRFCQSPELCADALGKLVLLLEGDELLPEGFGFVEESLAGELKVGDLTILSGRDRATTLSPCYGFWTSC